jgi:hypothetical protein
MSAFLLRSGAQGRDGLAGSATDLAVWAPALQMQQCVDCDDASGGFNEKIARG